MVKWMRGTLLYAIMLCAVLVSTAESATLMYVANEGDHTVTVVNLETEEILTEIPTGDAPHAIVFAKGKAYVNNRGSEYLTVIDTQTLEVSGEIPLEAISFQLALSPNGETIAVSYKNALKVSLVDVATDTVSTLHLADPPAGGFLEKPMKHPHWSKDGTQLYVQNNIDNHLVKVDVASGHYVVANEIPLPGSNHDLVPSANDKIMYAVNQNTVTGTSLTVIDAEKDEIIKDIPIPLLEDEIGFGHHGGLTRNGKTFYFCNEGGRSVSLIDTVKMKVRKSIEVGNGAGHAVFAKDNQKVFIVPHKDNLVSVIDTQSEEVIENIEAGSG
ncbi:MAG: hypothetical protein D3925_16065, partial [Candidatus Electrothrix sp. AR5]|nr:hypothetical protein [Candidatus Electrothrix sp. AR5]